MNKRKLLLNLDFSISGILSRIFRSRGTIFHMNVFGGWGRPVARLIPVSSGAYYLGQQQHSN